MASQILVYVDWAGLGDPQRLGTLHCTRTREIERFEFEYTDSALTDLVQQTQFDPRQ